MQLDSRKFKALSSETRLRIIKNLEKRRMTLSELATELSMHVSTVKQHLDSLQTAGLVELNDEGRKWKYYSLTHDAKSLTSPYINEVKVVFPLSIILILLGFTMLQPLGFYSQTMAGGEKALQDQGMFRNASSPSVTAPVSSGILLPQIMIAIGSLLLTVAIFLLIKGRTEFGHLPEKNHG